VVDVTFQSLHNTYMDSKEHKMDRRIIRSRPNEETIQRVMKEMGWDHLTAYRHVEQREEIQRTLVVQYPLGKSQYLA